MKFVPSPRIRSIADFVVRPDLHTEMLYGLEFIEDTTLYSISGSLVCAPPGQPGGFGDEVNFLYTVWNEPHKVGDWLLIEPEMMYRVGPKMLNDWAFVMSHNPPYGFVVHSNRYDEGLHVMFDPKLAHRLVPEGLAEDPLYAVRDFDILMIGK